MNVVTNNKWIGQRTIRPDGVDKVTGRAAFAADTTMPGMIWGKVLRSPHPHARIKSINTSKAEALPGVKAVVTAKDIVDFPLDKSVMLGIQDMRWMCRNVMAREKALFPGHPVAAVAATTEEIAAHACTLIEVDYEVLPWSIEIDDAIKPDAPILHDFLKFEGKPSNIAGRIEITKGDIAEGFAAAEIVIERSFTTRPVHQGYIEPHACLISVGADNKTTIWSSSQGQFMVRAMTSMLTGIQHVLSIGYDVLSNRSKVAAYRAPGAPIGAYAVECVLDELAETLKMDPLQLRLKNGAKQGTKASHGPVYPRIGYIETVEAALA